jgi:uncharacterized SAM-binding protein YcdF (DUF218 family)
LSNNFRGIKVNSENTHYGRRIPDQIQELGFSEKEGPHGNMKDEESGRDMDNELSGQKDRRIGVGGVLKWIFFVLLIAYALISHYREPILARMGSYLVVAHPLKRADIIVCMMGEPVERGLAAAEAFGEGLAPYVFLSREELPDGADVLKEKGVNYPESRDLLITLLKELGVPVSACIASDQIVGSTFEEAQVVRKYVTEQSYNSIIIVTSPFHTRRTWLSFKKVFEQDDVEIMMLPTKYSSFSSDNWWETRKHLRAVIIEYQKLLYYKLKYL